MRLSIAFSSVVVFACGGGSSSNQGELDGPCYPNGTCNVGLSCMAGTCAPADAAVPIDAEVILDASVDAAFACANDSAFEPNDSIQTAFQTPVDAQQQSISLTGLAICPEGDKDTFKTAITVANRNLEVIASWQDGEPIDVSVLNAGGSSIANGTPMGANAKRICVPNLPVATFFVSVFAGNNVQNNYSLVIRVVPNC